MTNIERDYSSNDDLNYFIEKIRNRGKVLAVTSYSASKEPEYVSHYLDFIQQYIGFTLTNISGIYNELANWIKNNPAIRDKIHIIDSNDIGSEVFNYVRGYLDKKLTPSVHAIALSLLDISSEQAGINLETHNIPALAFLSPPGTSKTYSIVGALKKLSEGRGNSIIAGWLHYDVTKHEATTAPLVLPTANQVVKDEPLPGVALLRTSGNVELDKALGENIYTKTVNKIITTFRYILIAGLDKGLIPLSNEVESTLKQRINLNSTELSMWKLAVIDQLDEKTISALIDTLRNVIPGFARVANILRKNKQHINNNADELINAMNYANFEASDPERDVQNFCEVSLILHKLIAFGLVLIIAISFRNFIRDKRLDENTNTNTDVLDGIMYIYNKIHNDYLHRIISTLFLVKALLNINSRYKELFKEMIKNLKVGLNELLNNCYKLMQKPDTTPAYLKLEEKVDLTEGEKKVFNFYNKIYRFLINAQPTEQDEYVLLDKLFINTVLNQLVLDTNDITISSGGSKSEEGKQTENIQYRDIKARQYSDLEYPEVELDYFSDKKLGFSDQIRLISDTINDFYEVKKFYSNVSQDNLSNQEVKTTLERLRSEFGVKFLEFNNTKDDDILDILAFVFTVIGRFKKELTESDYIYQKTLYKNQEIAEILRIYAGALRDLFKKSLNAIVYSPRYGHLIENNKLGTSNVDMFGLVGDYILSGLGITESLQTKGVSYSFPPAVQVFLARAKQAYYKYLRQLRAMIEANMKQMDVNNSINKAIETLRPPLYVLFLDEIMTHLTPENFLFWLNIWNGLISPANPTVDTYPPNLCFVLAGNMPWSTFILFEALAQSSTATSHQELMEAFKEANTNIMISEDTIHALGSRISLRVVAYDYAYLLRTDDSAVRTRTALFVRALTKGLLNRKDLIHFANTAQNLLGGFYDYYKLIVLPRLEGLGNLGLSDEKKMKLHAYIASLTAAPDNIPFNLVKIEPNAIIRTLIKMDYERYVSQDKMDEAIKNATILNYLFNSETFGKTIYEYMFGMYFKENPKEADYFNRLITIAISPIVLHLSFLHSYLEWNNMMRRLAKQLINKAKINQEKPEIVDAATKLMQVIKDASKLLNTRMTTAESIESTMGKRIVVRDRLDSGTYEASRDDFIKYIRDTRDPRFCDPEVGAFISLLSLVFYHYIKYMKEFNENISYSIIEFCEELESLILKEAKVNDKENYTREFKDLKYKIYNYFVEHSTDIDSKEDLLKDATVYLYDPSQSVRINILSFDPKKDKIEYKGKSFGTYPSNANNSITVTLIPEGNASKASKGLNSIDIKAIEALVAYTIYTHSLVSKKTQNYPASNKLIFSQDLIGNIIVTNTMHAPLVGHLALGFFRPTDENKLFLIQPLREADRWFTNVTGSVVKYVTIMTILKHILTYRYIKNSPNMIEGFMKEVKNSNAFSKNVEETLGRILDEFAELLFEARQAVFTPLANGGKENQNDQYRVFNYEYLDTAGTKSEGYYTTPDNKVNFGPLDFVFKELKGINIVQYDNSTHNSENNGERVIETIAEKFIQYLKNKQQSSTTSFFPIHLISHIEIKRKDTRIEDSLGDLLKYTNISSLLYRNQNKEHITMSKDQYKTDGSIDLRHEGFYQFNEKEYTIYAIIKVLNDGLKAVKRTNVAPIVIDELIEQNNKLEELHGKSNINSDNFMKLLYKARMLTNAYQNVDIRDGVFEDLKKVVTKYPSVNDYVKLWFEEKNNIKLFFKNLLEAIAEQNLDDLSSTVIGVLHNLDTYIVKTAEQLLDKVSDENIRGMLKQISEKGKLNESIESIIRGIMNSDLTNHIAVYIDEYKSSRGDAKEWEECIKYQITLLSPLIKYSLAIILSNIFLIESGDTADRQGINKEQFYSQLKQAIENSYNKTIKDSDRGSSDYLSMIIRYIFFDMNRYDDNDKEMRLSGTLIAKTQPYFPQQFLDSLGSSTSHYNLVQPFFTHYEDKKDVVEKDKQNNKDIIKKRVVFTQYVCIVHNEQPILYCDIHHMPIKGIQKIDGTVVEVPSKITIYSSEEFKSDQSGYAYAQLTFMRNTVVPRYEFAKSALVNLLLIAGIQEIQNSLLNPQNTVRILFNARFASFAITNLYKYYYDEIKDSNNSAYNLIDKTIYNRKSSSHHKHLHPLLAAIILSFNSNNETVKQILQNDYGLGNPGTYSRRDDFINALRLRFYSSTTSGTIQSAEYDMYSIYEPGVSIK